MDALAPDRARQHLHRLVTAQLADADRAQPIGPGGKQPLVPLVQGGQAQRLVEFAGGGQQHIQQALHLGRGLGLAGSLGQSQAACDRGAHLAWV